MKLKNITLLLLAAAPLFMSCSKSATASDAQAQTVTKSPKGENASFSVSLQPFHTLKVESAVIINYEPLANPTGRCKAVVTCDSRLRDALKISQNGDILSITVNGKLQSELCEKYKIRNNNGYTVTLSGPENIGKITLSGASAFTASAPIMTKGDFNLSLTSAATFKAASIRCAASEIDLQSAATFTVADLSATEISMKMTSASTATLKETRCKSFSADLSSASNFKLGDGMANDLTVTATGASGATIDGKYGDVSFDATGASTINFYGSHTGNIDISCSGAASINTKK